MALDPSFSVIMPVYNGAPFLRRSIGSVQAQSDEDWELLAVDDGSTDDSLDVLSELARDDRRIHVLHSPSSGGPATPRNVGLAAARGSIVCLIDQDDEWLPEKLAVQRAKFASGDFGLVYSDAHVVGLADESFLYGDRWGPMFEGDVAAPLIENCFIPTLTVAMRTSVVRLVGEFSRRLDGADDYEYWLRAAFAGQTFGRISEPLAVWHHHGGNLSWRIPRQQLHRYRCLMGLARRYPDRAEELKVSADRARSEFVQSGLRSAWRRPNSLLSAARLNLTAVLLARNSSERRTAVSALVKGPPRRYYGQR